MSQYVHCDASSVLRGDRPDCVTTREKLEIELTVISARGGRDSAKVNAHVAPRPNPIKYNVLAFIWAD